jgi:hypothetical protein
MARHITTIDSNRSADDVFDFLCDMRNASKWDPGVVTATVSETGVTRTVSEGTAFDVTLKVAGRERHVTVTTVPVGSYSTAPIPHFVRSTRSPSNRPATGTPR